MGDWKRSGVFLLVGETMGAPLVDGGSWLLGVLDSEDEDVI